MKKLLKNKLFIVSLLFIVLLFYFTSFVKAKDGASFKFNENTFNVILPDSLVGNYAICYDSGCYALLYTTSSAYFKITNHFNEGRIGIQCYSDSSCKTTKPYNILIITPGNGVLDFVNGNFTGWKPTDYQQRYDCASVAYCSVDVLDTDGSIFFQPPPPVVEEPEETALLKVMKQEMEQKMTLQEIIQILPLIIVVVVSLVGLRKALKILVIFLKTS